MPDSETRSVEVSRHIWTVPNFISFLRIASIPVIAWLIASNHLLWSLLLMALSGISDGVDGYVARRFDQVSVLGQILDPIADRLLIICSCIALAVAQLLPWWILIVICCRDFVIGIEVLILANKGYGPLPVHFVGKVGTFVILVAIPCLIISHVIPPVSLAPLSFYCFGMASCYWGIGLYWMAGIVYIAQGISLMKKRKH
ncbi:MAG: CDP-alcohol phosphatidyltransferase family protein [Aeriscardovia sp.]|nr:CDP-alcohol phosphatidyltransferase family protein [Aeriscardovia sp.]MBQ1357558.1 CDP-alcohol phosphatidyltransferase family protein [Aeriscardovia sp.]MBQ1424855.1 CDP-alcohol phosphatidyltransferase family protein [Aeriscardovia sp.]MBQ5493330.1 CDP-alcohol phosphatidyltransferase family protein [Aeriscardovia sp.]MBQ5520497.1 CDP-alcohol phosphatidyltransferase family protein [Aeriscardovia sp.]